MDDVTAFRLDLIVYLKEMKVPERDLYDRGRNITIDKVVGVIERNDLTIGGHSVAEWKKLVERRVKERNATQE